MAMNLDINRLTVDPSLQPRVGGLDADHVRELQEAPDSWPPLIVVERDGKCILIDGFHRLAAAQNLGMQEVQVQVVEVPTDGDLHSLAFALNAVHGRPLSLADRRAFAERLLGRHPEWADREIGRRCGLSSNTVGAIRERLEATGIEQPSTRVGAGGYVYNVGTNPKQRPLGELPDAGFGDVIGDTLGRLFTPAERVQQRRIAGYLQRLATALQEQKELQGWEKPEDAAQACLAVLGKEKSDRLAVALGWTARSVLDAAISLGYQDQEA